MKKFYDPPAFSWPPYSIENDSPLNWLTLTQDLDQNSLKNYRPVSNIKFLSKVIEKHIVNNITEHMIENNLGEPLQSAYRVAHSTETALLKVKNDIMTSIHNRHGVFLVLLDLSAAFDTVTHEILFDRMENEIGITGSALKLLKSYFTGRTTSVCINGVQSDKCSLDYGLPQGSIVGPLSFTIYTIPIGRIIKSHGLSYHLYADDVQLYVEFDESSNISIKSALSRLTKCINDIKSWMTCNMLKLNNDKTEFFIALSPHNKRRMPDVKLQIGQEEIIPSETVRNLGVILTVKCPCPLKLPHCHAVLLTISVTYHVLDVSWTLTPVTMSFVHLFYLDWTMAMFYSWEQMTLILHAFSAYKTGRLSSFSSQARKTMLPPFSNNSTGYLLNKEFSLKFYSTFSSVLLTQLQLI